MGLELVIFIVALLFGIFLYWRESNSNSVYRVLNKIMNSKELQMKPDDKRGFVFKQPFIPRLIFVISLVLVAALIVEFLTPIAVFSSYNGISSFSSFAAGTLIGTYLATFVIKSTVVIEEKSDTLSDMVGDAVDKGKELIKDLKNKDAEPISDSVDVEPKPEVEPGEKKSARERLKDKGLM